MSPLCKVLYLHLLIWSSQQYPKVGTAIIPILQIRNVRVRVTQESHTAGGQQSQVASPAGALSTAVPDSVAPFLISRFPWNATESLQQRC